jgi:hypothetical protein
LLYVDVDIGEGMCDRVIVYKGDTAAGLANQFANKHGLN